MRLWYFQCESSKMLRQAILLLFFASTIIIGQSTGKSSCPTNFPCYCFSIDPDEYRIHCTINKTTSSSFDLTIQPENFVRIQCKNSPDWDDFLLGGILAIGPVRKFIFTGCKLPIGIEANEEYLRQLGVSNVEKIKFESLDGGLRKENLQVFPDVKDLVLSDNVLRKVGEDLLKGLPRLTKLDLRETKLQIPQGFFNKSSSLKSLELSGNNLNSLEPGVFDGLENIELLNLWRNNITDLDPNLFQNLSTLISLDIHMNNLTTLPVEIFKDLRNLKVINFSFNNFTSLPAGLFDYNRQLRTVKLFYNRCNITGLPSRFLADLQDLKIASLMRIGLLDVPEDMLWGSSNLVELNLNRNYLTTLPADFLKDATELHTLGLSFNDLKELPDGLFTSTSNLVKLDLSRNHLTSINENIFEGLEKLQELNMENNDLTHINVDAFGSLVELKLAKFSNNQLSLRTSMFDIFGHVSPFHPCQSLEELYLSHNNISEIFSDWIVSIIQLRKLDLSYNQINYLETEDLQFISNTLDVDLSHNEITQINLARLEYMSSNETSGREVTINLDENPVQCDCDLYPLLHYINPETQDQTTTDFAKFQVETLICDGPEYMQGLRLIDLVPSELKCLVVTEEEESHPGDPCAPGAACDCWLRPSDRALILDCSNRNLTNVPEWIDTRGVDVVDIDLSMNSLEEAPDMKRRGYNKVRSLNLAGNSIERIDENLISKNLKVLNLDHNNLKYIDPEVLHKISNGSSISKLTLHENPWTCDCNLIDLHYFVQSNFLDIPDLLNVKCVDTNVSISSMTPADLCPISINLLISLCLLIALLGILIGIFAALYFRYQRQIKIWLYSKNLCLCLVTEDEMDREKTYDAFISYSHKDEEFVIKELVTKLEDGPKPYKVCIHIRDWLAGDWIPNQIIRSVEESRRTIVVLSPSFMESVWGKLEFQTAHKQALSDKRARVIVILYGDIKLNDIVDPDLKAYLQMNTYVRWGDPWFWEKLRYAMPHSVGIPKQIQPRKFDNIDEVNRKSFRSRKIEEVKIMIMDERTKDLSIIEKVKDISRNSDKNFKGDNMWYVNV